MPFQRSAEHSRQYDDLQNWIALLTATACNAREVSLPGNDEVTISAGGSKMR